MNTSKVRFRLLVGFSALVCVALMLPGCARFDGVVDFTSDRTSGKAPLTVQFTPVVEGSVRRYVWSFGDGQTSTERSPEYTYVDAGMYTVILMVDPRRREPTSARKEGYVTVTAGGFGSPPRQLVVQDDDFEIGGRGDVHGVVNSRGDTVYVLNVLANDTAADGASGLTIIGMKQEEWEDYDDYSCCTTLGTVRINHDETAIEYEPYSRAYADPQRRDSFYYLATDGRTTAEGEVQITCEWADLTVRNDSFEILGASDVPEVWCPEFGWVWELDVLKNDSPGDGATELTIIGIRSSKLLEWGEMPGGDGWVWTNAAVLIGISPDGKTILLEDTGQQNEPFDTFYYLATDGVTTAAGEVRVDYCDE